MDGEEARAHRRQIGMSQAAFAEAIGISRETVGRLERGSENIGRRTELAIRFIVEYGPLTPKTLCDVHQNVADILDEVAVRGRISPSSQAIMRSSANEWSTAQGSEVGMALIRRAQATVGWLNSMNDGDSSRDKAFCELRQLKLAWSALANDL